MCCPRQAVRVNHQGQLVALTADSGVLFMSCSSISFLMIKHITIYILYTYIYILYLNIFKRIELHLFEPHLFLHVFSACQVLLWLSVL